jgi:protein CpxP
MNIIHKFQGLAAVGIMSLSLAAPAVFAQSTPAQQGGDQQSQAGVEKGFGGHHRGHGRHGMGRAFQALNLTDAQKAQAKQIRESHRDAIVALRTQIKAKRSEIRASEQGGTFNEALATQKLTEAAAIQAKLMGEKFQIRKQMMAVLTPEQKTKLDQMRTEWKAKRAERRAARQA